MGILFGGGGVPSGVSQPNLPPPPPPPLPPPNPPVMGSEQSRASAAAQRAAAAAASGAGFAGTVRTSSQGIPSQASQPGSRQLLSGER